MAFKIDDRIKETTITTGTGSLLLLGAVGGFRSFSAGVEAGNTTYYTIVESGPSNPQWEVGLGTYNVGNILTRDIVYSSSNTGNLVVFGEGVKNVYVDLPASRVGLQVNGVSVPAPANLQNNPAALGVDTVISGTTSNVLSNVRRADVAGVADEEIGLLIGAPANRVQISGGEELEQVLIPTFSSPPTLIVTVRGSATAIAAQLTNAGRTTISSAITGGATLVASGFSSAGAANNQVTVSFSGATIAQIQAIFAPGGNRLRSDQVFAGTALEGQFVYTQNNGSPRRAIGALLAPGQNISLTRDATTDITTIAATGIGANTLQGLTDTQITEPLYAQVGTFTVATVSPGIRSITTSATPTGLAVGDWLRGASATPGQLPAIQIIFITGTLIEFSFDPTPFFAVGNFIYRLPSTIEGSALFFSNAQNKWIAEAPNNTLPLDTLDWVNLTSDIFVTDVSAAVFDSPVTTNTTVLTGPWTFPLATLPFTSQNEIVGVDTFGRMVSGEYVSAADSGTATAILQNPLPDRRGGGGFALNQAYTMSWRQGRFALSDYVRFNNTNAIIQGLPAVNLAADAEIARLIGSQPAYTDSGATTGPTGFGNVGTTANVPTALFATLKAFLQTPDIGAIPGTGSGTITWTLPTAWTIRISATANPTALQFGTVDRITEITASSVLQVRFGGGNIAYFTSFTTAQELFFLGRPWVFQVPPRDEIIRLAQANDVSSLNTLQRAVTIAAGTGIGVATDFITNQILLTNTGSGSALSSNSTTYDSTQSSDNGMFVVQTSQGQVANALLIGMPLRMATQFDQNSTGGDINGIFYVNSGNTNAQRGINFPVSVNPIGDFRVFTSFGAFIIDITFSSNGGGDAQTGDIMFAGGWFSRANLASGTDPRLNSNLFPLFDNLQGASNEGRQLSPQVPPYVISRIAQGSTSTTLATYRYTIAASSWAGTGFSRNFVGASTEYHPYIELDEVGTAAVISDAVFVSQNVAGQPTAGGFELIIGIPGAAGSGTPSLQQVVTVGNTSNLPIIFQDTTAVTPRSASLAAPAIVTTSYAMALPVAQGALSSIMRNDGAGQLSWASNWMLYAGTCRYNDGIAPVANVMATFTTPPGTINGTVHSYNYFAGAVITPVYRFVPDTDSAVNLLGYDSFWSTFNGTTTLSNLIVQRGSF